MFFITLTKNNRLGFFENTEKSTQILIFSKNNQRIPMENNQGKKKRTRLVTKEQKERRKQEILSLASLLLVEGGYRNVKIRDIAKDLGTSPASIYSYYNSKEEILIALMDNAMSELEQTFELIEPEETTDIKDKLLAICRQYYQFASTHSYFYKLMFESSYETPIYPDAPQKVFKIFQYPIIQIFNNEAGNCKASVDEIKILSMGLWSLLHGGRTLSEEIFKETNFEAYLEKPLSLYIESWIAKFCP
ncbi:MAG: TetR/AcrR family transcriptional regulator [Methanobacteriota archaeon]|nr:MAG: TetR/AcrR family transcriptional regulator [Euryarchaeota archaeon]